MYFYKTNINSIWFYQKETSMIAGVSLNYLKNIWIYLVFSKG